ncbi:glycosyltransferase [Paraflavitalea sp. CAU 1676]|uniref:glycosyltransferase family protein n=1 Tax=Paraflavitalea sp. CAU 1676 TaxID=3032598 RepID=UPI0023DC90E6|nr:glycosyltransferase [Paraflavitalea sp. CAU 1676]MDF2191704.1 glycosyltransferase [Paraflavitalea sp. CAU 1676]
MTIALIHHNKAFLPAIYGYTRFFAGLGIRCEAVTPRELPGLKRQVDWYFMGLDRSAAPPGVFRIHQYISPSTPPLRGLKDWGKLVLNAKPDLRIFKNEYTQGRFPFRDSVPSCMMEVGIADEWFAGVSGVTEKVYDFIYVGDLSAGRNPEQLLDRFTEGDLRERSLLLLSRNYEALRQRYSAYSNIIFKGPVEKAAVMQHILQSRFALNYIPDKAPFNQLTSTKFLEYAACGVPVVTTDYAWAQDFARSSGGRFLFVAPDLHDLSWEKVTSFDYFTPDMRDWSWAAQIRQSGVLAYLKPFFPAMLEVR